MAGMLSHNIESNSMLPPFSFRIIGAWEYTMLSSHCLTIYTLLWTGAGGGERLVQLDFSTAFGRGNHCGLLYKLRSKGIGGQFLSIVSEFLSDRRQRVRLNS